MEVVVSAEDNVELRRITLTNLSSENRTIDLTSYSEPVLSTADADLAHSTFNKLFIQTEYINEKSALLANRRKRSEQDENLFGLHQVVYDHQNCKSIQYETDREKFLGRRNPLSKANGLKRNTSLSNTVGGVLDPIFSFKVKIQLSPHESTQVTFVSGLARSRDEALRLIDQYHDGHAFEREDQMSWTQNQVRLKHLNIEIGEEDRFQRITGPLVYSSSKLRHQKNFIQNNPKSQKELWSHGISGDLPILLVYIKSKHDISFITDILQFHEYLRSKNISFDLVVLSDESSTYRMAIHEELLHHVRNSGGQGLLNKRGGIFLQRKDTTTDEDFIFLKSVARVYFDAHQGNLKKQVNQLLKVKNLSPIKKHDRKVSSLWKDFSIECPKLEFFNGIGGFSEKGLEYQIYLEKGKVTPAPWINVISNSKSFGCLFTESGSSHTWSQNSRENRLTPWNNDPTLDQSGELIYLKDQDSSEYWSPTPGPCRDQAPYLIRHGQGYTTFEHKSFEISQKLTIYVSLKDELKFIRLKVKNLSSIKRNIAAYYFLEWVLGFHRTQTAHHITTKQIGTENIFYAQNPFHIDFGKKTSFASSNQKVASFTCDRASFLGRHGDYDQPIGLSLENLDGKIGAALDPCLAMKVDMELDPQEEEEVIFLLGPSIK